MQAARTFKSLTRSKQSGRPEAKRYSSMAVSDEVRRHKKFWGSASWKRTRHSFKIRNPICCDPLGMHPETVKPTEHVHHKISLKRDWRLRLVWTNLAGLCGLCHNTITGRERGGECLAHLFQTGEGGANLYG